MTSRGRRTIAWVAAILIAATGLVVAVIGMITPVAFGWFAYQPLSSATFAIGGDGIFASRVTVIGAVILAVGLICVAFLAGIRAGAKDQHRYGGQA